LATMVVLFHFIATYNIEVYGDWMPPDSAPLSNTGPISVSLFFMISGFLFFSVINKVDIKWGRFFISRALRIYPVYLLVILVVCYISYVFGDKRDFFGILNWLVFIGSPIFGFKESYLVNSGVQWTLMYEVIFYGSLPLAWCIRTRKFASYILAPFFVLFVSVNLIEVKILRVDLLSLFFIGGICNYLSRKESINRNTKVIGNAGFVFLLYAFFFTEPYSPTQFVILGFSFLGVVIGGGVFNLLNNKYLVSVGEVSYSVYMIHGLVLFILFRTDIIDLKKFSLFEFMPFLIIVMIITSILACITYQCIEKKFMMYGKRINK